MQSTYPQLSLHCDMAAGLELHPQLFHVTGEDHISSLRTRQTVVLVASVQTEDNRHAQLWL